MAEPLEVQLVATDREVWSGQATMVTFETHDGSVGIMQGHSPLLAMLRDGVVTLRPPEGEDFHASVHGGFALVDSGNVYILAQTAEMANEIDIARAKALIEEAEASDDGPGKEAAIERAKNRLAVAEKHAD